MNDCIHISHADDGLSPHCNMYHIEVYNYSGQSLYWSYYGGFEVNVKDPNEGSNYWLKPPFNIGSSAILIPAESSVILPDIDSIGIYVHGRRISTYVPGAIGVDISLTSPEPSNIAYSFYLVRLGALIDSFTHFAKYAYVSQVKVNNISNSSLRVYLNYYDPTHIGYNVNDYLCGNLQNIATNPNGGYIQNLGGDSPDFIFYICDSNNSSCSALPSDCTTLS